MSGSVYPSRAQEVNASSQTHHFSPIPNAVLDLRRERKLTPRDVDVLVALLSYKKCSDPKVDPEQNEIAALVGCSEDTIQRSTARLRKAGLIVTERLRDMRGRLGRMVYDLSAILALMPAKAAKTRSGQWGRSETISCEKPATTPQKCGVSEPVLNPEVVLDNIESQRAEAATSQSPVVALLMAQGMHTRRAGSAAIKFGEARCRQALNALEKCREKVKNPGGWLLSRLQEGWDVKSEIQARPLSSPDNPCPSKFQPAPDKPSTSAEEDVLASLSPEEWPALEKEARARVIAEKRDPIRTLARQGKAKPDVERMMREILASRTDQSKLSSCRGTARNRHITDSKQTQEGLTNDNSHERLRRADLH